jgi:hypothetical protein
MLHSASISAFAGGGQMRVSSALFLIVVSAALCTAQDTSFAAGPQYLITTTNTRFLHPIATPSMSLDAPLQGIPSLPPIGRPVTDQPYVSNPELTNQPDLFPIYYGYPPVPVVELTGEAPREVPASINNTGFLAITSVTSLRERGYGVTVAEDAAFWKTHTRRATRVYRNTDLQH